MSTDNLFLSLTVGSFVFFLLFLKLMSRTTRIIRDPHPILIEPVPNQDIEEEFLLIEDVVDSSIKQNILKPDELDLDITIMAVEPKSEVVKLKKYPKRTAPSYRVSRK